MIWVPTAVAKKALKRFPLYLSEETANFVLRCIKALMLLQLATGTLSVTLRECFRAVNVSAALKPK